MRRVHVDVQVMYMVIFGTISTQFYEITGCVYNLGASEVHLFIQKIWMFLCIIINHATCIFILLDITFSFVLGSIMSVTLSDPYAQNFQSRFVGICIERNETGLRHNFTLRNVIDGQGIEIMYELYNPTIKKIEVRLACAKFINKLR